MEPEVHYCVNRSPPVILSSARCIQSTPSYSISLKSIPSISSKWSLPFRFSDQNVIYISHPSYACCMPHPSLDLPTLNFIQQYRRNCKEHFETISYDGRKQLKKTSKKIKRSVL
jgi:hypothetical protein